MEGSGRREHPPAVGEIVVVILSSPLPQTVKKGLRKKRTHPSFSLFSFLLHFFTSCRSCHLFNLFHTLGLTGSGDFLNFDFVHPSVCLLAVDGRVLLFTLALRAEQIRQLTHLGGLVTLSMHDATAVPTHTHTHPWFRLSFSFFFPREKFVYGLT